MKYLLNDCINKIDVNSRNREEKNALHLSSQYESIECTKLLIDSKVCDINALKRSDWTPLMLALTKRNLDIIKLLVESGAHLTIKDKYGWNGFHISVRTGFLPIIQYLLDFDPNICYTLSNTNRSPLHTASICGHYSVVDYLLNNCHYSCDQRDSCNDCVDISRLFVEKQKVNPLLSDVLGRNALHISSEANALNSIKYLINELNFDINCVTTVGNLSPLHFAAKESHYETIKLLLDFGADLSLRDSKGRTAYDIAIAFKHFNCAELLK
jgi:ankyrin repeat protein